MRGKKGAIVIGILIIVIIVMAVLWIVNIADRECSQDSDCGSERYCGSDYTCHEFKVIEKTVIENDYTTAAAIIGLAIVIAAIIFRYGKK